MTDVRLDNPGGDDVDAMLRRSMGARAVPTPATDLAARAMAAAAARHAATEARLSWLRRRRWIHRAFSAIAVLVVLSLVTAGAMRVAASTSSSSQTSTVDDSSSTSSASTDSTTSYTLSGTGALLLIGGCIAVLAVVLVTWDSPGEPELGFRADLLAGA